MFTELFSQGAHLQFRVAFDRDLLVLFQWLSCSRAPADIFFSILITQTFFVCGWIDPYLNFRWGQNLRFVLNTDAPPHHHPNLSLSTCLHQCLLITPLSLPPCSLHPSVHNWTMEDTVQWLKESVELPQYEKNFRDFRVTGNTLPRLVLLTAHLLLSSTFVTNSKGAERQVFASRDDGEAGD